MPLRDIVLTLTVFGLLPACVARPWIGILVWTWIGYMNPHRLTWEFAFSLPFAMLVAIATVIGMLITSDPERRPIPWYRETWLLAVLWGIYTFTTILSLYPDESWPQLIKVSKFLLFTFIPLMYFQSRERLRYLLLVMALSLGFYGLKGGIWVLRTGGVHNVMGPEGTFIGGNTELGLALNMILPFLLMLAREERILWLRRGLYVVFAFSILAVIFTYSRGAWLGLPVVLLMLFAHSRRRVLGLVAMLLLGFFVMTYAPERLFERAESISAYEEDRSAVSRLESWYVAWRLALDRPLTGGGFWALPHDEIFGRYLPDYIRAQSAHSIYFSVLGDHGFPGLAVFAGLILSCFGALFALRRRSRREPALGWVAPYSHMVEASLMAYVVSGAFLQQAYWDMFYHLVMIVILLKAIVEREAAGAVSPPATATARVPALRRATP